LDNPSDSGVFFSSAKEMDQNINMHLMVTNYDKQRKMKSPLKEIRKLLCETQLSQQTIVELTCEVAKVHRTQTVGYNAAHISNSLVGSQIKETWFSA